jgi:hypothetical protein
MMRHIQKVPKLLASEGKLYPFGGFCILDLDKTKPPEKLFNLFDERRQ